MADFREYVPHYKVVESTPQLPVGNYKAKIAKVDLKVGKQTGRPYLSIKFEIEGHLGEKPDTAIMFGEPENGDFRDAYNRDLTLFFDTFGITRGEFETDKWIGCEGEITVFPKADNSGYNDISYIPLTEKRLQNRIKKAEEAAEEAKKNAAGFTANQPAQPPIQIGVPVTSYPPTPTQPTPAQPTLDNFPEDFPS